MWSESRFAAERFHARSIVFDHRFVLSLFESPMPMNHFATRCFIFSCLLTAITGSSSTLIAQDKLKTSDNLKNAMDRKILQSDTSSGRYYNSRGSSIGKTESRGGTSRVYDSAGRSKGSVENRGGSTRSYDSSGRVQGRSETTGNKTRFYDPSGRSMGSSQSSGNSTRFYSPSGSYQGRAETRNGTTRYYDSSGRSLGSKK